MYVKLEHWNIINFFNEKFKISGKGLDFIDPFRSAMFVHVHWKK